MKLDELVAEIKKFEKAPDGFDYVLAYMYSIGMPPPPDDFVKKLITKENPNVNFYDVRSKWICEWIRMQFTPTAGYAVFVGPCAHGRDPWDRCDECGEGTAIQAAVKRINALEEEIKKLKATQTTGRASP